MSHHQPIDPLDALDHDEAHYRDIAPPAFNPPEHIATKILSDLCSSQLSLGDIASKARTTFESLSLWLTRPDIEARMNAMESVFARRCRLQLANNTGGIIKACNAIIDNYTQSESHLLFRDDNLRGHALMARKGHNALTATKLLLHLAKHFTSVPGANPRPQPARTPPTPPAPTPDSDPTPAPDLHSERTSRLTLLSPLKLTPLKLHGIALDPTHPTLPREPQSPNPTRENGTHIQNPRGNAGVTGAAPPHSHDPTSPGVTAGVPQAISAIQNPRGNAGATGAAPSPHAHAPTSPGVTAGVLNDTPRATHSIAPPSPRKPICDCNTRFACKDCSLEAIRARVNADNAASAHALTPYHTRDPTPAPA